MPPEQLCLGTVAGAASLFNAEGPEKFRRLLRSCSPSARAGTRGNFFPFDIGSCRGILKVSGQLSGVVVVPNGANHIVIPYGYDADSLTRFVVKGNQCRRVL